MYADYLFKRLFSSEHILLGFTFIFPHGFSQTMIFMLYDIIIFKFIPCILILTNNKSYNYFIHIFNDIIELIENYEKDIKNSLNWKIITNDFELSLIKAFDKTFNNRSKDLKNSDVSFILWKTSERT